MMQLLRAAAIEMKRNAANGSAARTCGHDTTCRIRHVFAFMSRSYRLGAIVYCALRLTADV